MKEAIQLIRVPVDFFGDPRQRLFWFYLFISLVVFLVVSFRRQLLPQFIREGRKHHSSLLVDLKLWLFNAFLRALISSLGLISLSALILLFVKSLYLIFPDWEPYYLPYSFVAILLTLVSFILFDGLRFLQHFLMHKIPFLWAFHQVHHSATYLTPLTLYRMHPIENLVSAFRRLFGQTLVFGSFMFLFGASVNAYDILGVNSLAFVANLALSNLRHSPLVISFGQWERIFISPAQHQMHHSNVFELSNSNYGVVLSFWDRLANSLVLYQGQKIEYGLKDKKLDRQTLFHQLISPFSTAFQSWRVLGKATSLHLYIRKKVLGTSINLGIWYRNILRYQIPKLNEDKGDVQ